MCAMEPSRGVSPSSSISAGQLMLFVLGTIISNRAVDAYVASPSLPSIPTVISSNTATRINLNRICNGIGYGKTFYMGRTRSLRLYSSDKDDSDSTKHAKEEPFFATSVVAKDPASATTKEAKFGDVMPIQRKSTSASSAQFGDVVSISRPSSSPSMFEEAKPKTTTSKSSGLSDVEMLKQRRSRNIGVAILSVLLALGNYAYEWTHPATPIQLLVNMERANTPLSDVGKNSKPTVIDFWAPWCENCRYMAPKLFQIEENYKGRVNFVMVNADDPANWPLIEALGVDAIPHMALLESDGTVDTALIGTVPKEWLAGDLDVLIANANKKSDGSKQTEQQTLPHQMLDVFANRPEDRKLANLDTVFDAGRR